MRFSPGCGCCGVCGCNIDGRELVTLPLSIQVYVSGDYPCALTSPMTFLDHFYCTGPRTGLLNDDCANVTWGGASLTCFPTGGENLPSGSQLEPGCVRCHVSLYIVVLCDHPVLGSGVFLAALFGGDLCDGPGEHTYFEIAADSYTMSPFIATFVIPATNLSVGGTGDVTITVTE